MKVLSRWTVMAGLLAFAQAASAVPLVFYGTGVTTTNADVAHAAWSATVTGAVTDQLDGLGGTTGTNASLTSSLGNNFTSADDLLSVNTFSTGVIQGTSLNLTRVGTLGTFTWNLVTPSDAFGFFGWDNDNGTITITFQDGITQTYTAPGALDNIFWGISGLNSLVSSVSISTTDPGGLTNWDRFTYATSVPEPGTLALLALALAGLGFTGRRKLD